MMSSGISDPNNHVPEVAPGDDWDDADFDFGTPPLITMLPPKRNSAEAVEDEAPAVNIVQARFKRTPKDEQETSPLRLEVQEIHGRVVRLGSSMQTAKAERPAVFRERPARIAVAPNELGEDVKWGAEKVQSKRWLGWMAFGAVAIVVLGMLSLPWINSMNAERPLPPSGIFKVIDEEKVEGVDILNAMVIQQPDALCLFHAYATAAHPDHLLPIFRDGTRLRPTIQASWHPLGIAPTWQPATNMNWEVSRLAGRPRGILQGTLPDHSRFEAYFISEHGHLLLDWKATTAYSSAPFTQLEKGTGDAAEVRGTISLAETYSDVFPESEYQSYRFSSPDNEIGIWCYARRGEAADAEILPLLRAGEIVQDVRPSQRVTLRLGHGPDGAQPNQWILSEMLHIDWVAP